jgi:hypothetical protein
MLHKIVSKSLCFAYATLGPNRNPIKKSMSFWNVDISSLVMQSTPGFQTLICGMMSTYITTLENVLPPFEYSTLSHIDSICCHDLACPPVHLWCQVVRGRTSLEIFSGKSIFARLPLCPQRISRREGGWFTNTRRLILYMYKNDVMFVPR